MANAANWVERRRREAWVYGREQRDRLLRDHQERYRLDAPPIPALVIDELIVDLGAKLRWDPLPLDRFAETRLQHGVPIVTINSRLAEIEGVKDAQGVENVGKWHEAIHVLSHLDALFKPASRMFEGFDQPAEIVCLRAAVSSPRRHDDAVEREFFAEEAGRAAAVSIEALLRTEPYQELMRQAKRSQGPVRSAWPLLYQSASEIGVNISALVKQLSLEGRIVVQGRAVLVQPGMGDTA